MWGSQLVGTCVVAALHILLCKGGFLYNRCSLYTRRMASCINRPDRLLDTYRMGGRIMEGFIVNAKASLRTQHTTPGSQQLDFEKQ